jgi:leucyl/phenylalanyl-tRNA--protein transferase
MAIFPPLEAADEDGLLAVGGDYSLTMLLEAYCNGIFPWPFEDLPPLWFAPPQRAVLRFDEFHIPKSLRKEARRRRYQISFNGDFAAIMAACAAPRNYADGTWITLEMIDGYTQLHRAGYAHSVEVYEDGTLSGGLYGVAIGAYFSGESMFHHRDGASKFALIALIEHLKDRGATWLDVQQLSPLFAAFGAREIERAEFMKWHRAAITEPVKLFDSIHRRERGGR